MKTKKFKPKNKFLSSQRSIDITGKWKSVELDPSLFSEEGLEGLVCFEELTDYRLIDTEKAAANALKEEKKKKSNKRKLTDVAEDGEEAQAGSTAGNDPAQPKKKKKKKQKNKNKKAPADQQSGDVNKEEEAEVSTQGGGNKEIPHDNTEENPGTASDQTVRSTKTKAKKSGQQKEKDVQPATEPKEEESLSDPLPAEKEKPTPEQPSKLLKNQVKNWTSAALCSSADQNTDVGAWKDLFVPPAVLKALSQLGFGSPTPIQALALPPAIRDRMDILGAAETGSGKTFAYGIPMIHSILEWRNSSKKMTDDDATEPAPVIQSLYLPTEHEPTSDDNEEEDDGADDSNQEEEDEADDKQLNLIDGFKTANVEENPADGENQPLLGLVLTPTRELAVQVKHHIDAVAKFTDIKLAIVVGGMSQQKQRRMLKRRPEIIIATPGRLWDLMKQRHPHLLNLRQLRCLVIDEADRMVERGHFAELENLLEMLNTTHFNPSRQTFVFSATLTMAHSLPTRLIQKKKKLQDQRNKLEVLMEKVGIKAKPKVIDLTRKEATVETLTETLIQCQKEEKDFYLYYFLLQYPGRTIVFANSISCIKRLNSLLDILDCNPLPLHANMHQKQRLKNLERFAERESCVLLATDVAARGLDIPNVQHVIHYQVPRTSEMYVHRSGRTARATKEGLSLLLICPDDMMNFKNIYKTLGKDEELPEFPVETKCLDAIMERVNLARSIEKIEYFNCREKQHNSWFRQAADALEVDLDEDLLLGGRKDEEDDRKQQKMVKGMKSHLKNLISQPIFKNAIKTKYPTQMGKLSLPHMSLATNESALTRVFVQGKKKKLKRNQVL
uniref:ATP-dependent RNA helicase n=1 Tax=Gouania willdenowi TaxID=441366 RepID=A0A8C5E1R1_GOUWI